MRASGDEIRRWWINGILLLIIFWAIVYFFADTISKSPLLTTLMGSDIIASAQQGLGPYITTVALFTFKILAIVFAFRLIGYVVRTAGRFLSKR